MLDREFHDRLARTAACDALSGYTRYDGHGQSLDPGTISHNRILELYREIVDPTFTWQNFTQAEQAQVLKADRSNNCLDTSLLQSLAPYVLPIEESVREVLIEMRRTDDHNKLVRVVSK